MTKPMARQKTDEQLAAEEEERAAKEAEARRRDPDQPFVSVRAVAAGPGCAAVELSRRCVAELRLQQLFALRWERHLLGKWTPLRLSKSHVPTALLTHMHCCLPRHALSQKRELNPYLRDGGSGVPPEAPAEGGAAPAPAQRAAGVGDGGASWRLKALKRAQQQAESEVGHGCGRGV